MMKKLLKVFYKFIRSFWFNLMLNICSLSLWFYIFSYSYFTFQFEYKVVNYLVLIPFFLFLLRLFLWVQNKKSINPLFLSLFNILLSLKFFFILKKNPSDWTQAYSFIYIKKKHIFYDYDPIVLKDLPVVNNLNFVEDNTNFELMASDTGIASTFDADMQTVLIVGGVILGVLIIGTSGYLLYSYFCASTAAAATTAIAPAVEAGPIVVANTSHLADELVAAGIFGTYFTTKYYIKKIFGELSIPTPPSTPLYDRFYEQYRTGVFNYNELSIEFNIPIETLKKIHKLYDYYNYNKDVILEIQLNWNKYLEKTEVGLYNNDTVDMCLFLQKFKFCTAKEIPKGDLKVLEFFQEIILNTPLV